MNCLGWSRRDCLKRCWEIPGMVAEAWREPASADRRTVPHLQLSLTLMIHHQTTLVDRFDRKPTRTGQDPSLAGRWGNDGTAGGYGVAWMLEHGGRECWWAGEGNCSGRVLAWW